LSKARLLGGQGGPFAVAREVRSGFERTHLILAPGIGISKQHSQKMRL
jgi:orotidine-5'-phosphate decarboxylase